MSIAQMATSRSTSAAASGRAAKPLSIAPASKAKMDLRFTTPSTVPFYMVVEVGQAVPPVIQKKNFSANCTSLGLFRRLVIRLNPALLLKLS